MSSKDTGAIEKLNAMLENFQTLCCADDNCSLKTKRRPYTNFSVEEILRPDFRSSANKDYDSDGTYNSDSGEVYSSGDEIQETDGNRCESPEMLDSSALTVPVNLVQPKAYTLFQRFRRQYEDDGYSSSDSESALDLRIPRKKTPPKTTMQLPAWVFCTRYSDRPSTGRRARQRKQAVAGKRTRIAFNEVQLHQLNAEFEKDPYLSERRRQKLADELQLSETNVKIWFQNRRAKMKKNGDPHPLALQLQAEGLYNHKMAAMAGISNTR